MAERILIVDDEREITDLVALYLENERFTVFKCYTAQEAMDCIDKEKLDLAILDVMLPDMNGFEICKRIRRDYTYPVIMLTAKVAEVDRITGLTLGADDYVTKPFLPLELVARVKAQLRRYTQYNTGVKPDEDVIEHSGLVLNAKTRECTLNEKPLTLTPTEFAILKILCQNRGSVVSSEELFHGVWGEEYYSKNNNTITVHIRHVAVLPMDELMERAISHLSLSDSEQYGREQEWYEQEYGEKIVCNVTLSEMEYGLLRVKVPNTDDSYYYVPGILLFGSVEFHGETSGKVYDIGRTEPGLVLPMVALNAIDGTIVELSQE